MVLQPTSPLRRLSTVKKVLKKIISDEKISAVTTFCECSNSHPNYIYRKNKNEFIPLMKKKVKRRQNFKKYYFRTGVAYAVKTKFFQKSKKLYPKNPYGILLKDSFESINIDTKIDFRLAKYIIESKKK